jgi:hypothetical protein
MPSHFRCRASRYVVVAFTLASLLTLAGCFDWSSLSKPKTDPATSGAAVSDAESVSIEGVEMQEVDIGDAESDVERPANVDPFSEVELEAGQEPFLNAARPFLQAMAKRDYAAAFRHLSPKAKQKFSRNQFIPVEDEQEYARNDAAPIVNPTVEQFVQLMQEVEGVYGLPIRLDPPMVETDPEILERRDAVLAAFELGAMPDSIPVEQRKAAVQAWVYCRMTDDQIKAAAAEAEIDEAEYRQLVAEAEAGGEGPYFKLKTVVIDEGAGPVIGYFEIAQRSILD